MRTYKGFNYKVVHTYWCDYYQLYNERSEEETQCFSLKELKEIVDTRLRLGYWAY